MARGADKVPVASLSAPGSSVGRNRLHALASRQESEASIDVVTGDSVVAKRVYRGGGICWWQANLLVASKPW